jgi:hypothetical protein
MDLPNDFFTIATFSTLTGSALVVYFVTGIIAYLFNSDDLRLKKWLSFGLSFVVAFIGVILTEERPLSVWLLAIPNSLLIFATVIGGNAIFTPKQPSPTLALAATTLSRQAVKSPAARKTRTTRTTLGTHLFRTRWF